MKLDGKSKYSLSSSKHRHRWSPPPRTPFPSLSNSCDRNPTKTDETQIPPRWRTDQIPCFDVGSTVPAWSRSLCASSRAASGCASREMQHPAKPASSSHPKQRESWVKNGRERGDIRHMTSPYALCRANFTWPLGLQHHLDSGVPISDNPFKGIQSESKPTTHDWLIEYAIFGEKLSTFHIFPDLGSHHDTSFGSKNSIGVFVDEMWE